MQYHLSLSLSHIHTHTHLDNYPHMANSVFLKIFLQVNASNFTYVFSFDSDQGAP